MTLITEENFQANWVVARALEKIGIPELLPHLSEIVLTTSLYQGESRYAYDWRGISYVPRVMAAIQERCGYYNYALA